MTPTQYDMTDVIHTAGRVYKKKSVTMHTPGRMQILTLTLAVYHASFV